MLFLPVEELSGMRISTAYHKKTAKFIQMITFIHSIH